MDMVINLTVVTILQHIQIQNHYDVHPKLTQCYMSSMPQKIWKKNIEKKRNLFIKIQK